MNAIQFLKNEHNRVRRMFADISNNSHRHETKIKLFENLCHDLIRHETMEQNIWYPRLKKNEKLADIIKHLISEEKEANKTINQLEKIENPAEWEENFFQLKNAVEHHATEEEQKLFPKVEKILGINELVEIGKEMYAFKNEANKKAA